MEDGRKVILHDFDDIPQRQSLWVRIEVYQSATYLYFDGQATYMMSERTPLVPMTAALRLRCPRCTSMW